MKPIFRTIQSQPHELRDREKPRHWGRTVSGRDDGKGNTNITEEWQRFLFVSGRYVFIFIPKVEIHPF